MRTILAALLTTVGAAQADTVTVYSYCDARNNLKHSHSFAVFERGKESVCISFGPAKGDGTDAITRPVKGKNYSYAETVTWANMNGLKVQAFGPHNVRPALFDRAKAWAGVLDSGRVEYMLIDVPERFRACNCISVLFAVDGRRPITGFKHGPDASRRIARWLVRHYGDR